MKKKFIALLLGILIVITPLTLPISADGANPDESIQFTEELVDISTTAGLIEPYCHQELFNRKQFEINESKPVWNAYTNEEMLQVQAKYLPKGIYCFSEYSIEYLDGTFELGSEKTLIYNDLMSKKPIKEVHTYYAKTTTNTFEYY
ncbi:MAG: hypothetical protein RR565_10110 [Erysipelothrix sp.]